MTDADFTDRGGGTFEATGNARCVRVSACERGTPWGCPLCGFGVHRS